MIVGEPYQRDGRTLLRNLHESPTVPPRYVDTGLSSLPRPEDGKPAWDGAKVVPIVLTAEEKLDHLNLPPRVLAALVVVGLPAADTTGVEKAWARSVLLDALDRTRQARL